MPIIEVDEMMKFRIMNGSVLPNKYNISSQTLFVSDVELALYVPHPDKEGMMKPMKVL
jgi:fructose-specific component phosphotransferase system IIB-like protein